MHVDCRCQDRYSKCKIYFFIHDRVYTRTARSSSVDYIDDYNENRFENHDENYIVSRSAISIIHVRLCRSIKTGIIVKLEQTSDDFIMNFITIVDTVQQNLNHLIFACIQLAE